MAVYKMTPVSWNGVPITSYAPYWAVDDPNPMSAGQNFEPVDAVIPIRGNQAIRLQPKPTTWVMTIRLTDLQQSDIDGLYAVFDSSPGLAYLRCTDGDGTVWRIEAELLGTPRIVNTVQFKAQFYIPRPVWEKNAAETSVVNANQTTSPFNQVLTTAGNRDTEDYQLTISPDTAKTKGYNDYLYSFPGVLVNRAPNPLINEPCYLCDQSGAAGRLATDSSGSGATVQRTTNSTTVTVNIAAGATTITVASVAAFSATGGLGWITDSRGNGFHDQFSYTGISGLVLQGVVWLPAAANGREPSGTVITAGGIAHTTVQVTNIRASGTMLSADDLAVWMDGKKMDSGVYPVAWNSAASDVVACVTMPKRKYKTITSAMTAGSPANGGEVTFLEGVSDLPEKGYFVIDNEVFAYNARNVELRKVTDVRRGLHGSAAATHVINSLADFSIKLYVVAIGKATAGVTERPLALRPCIDIPASSNLVQRWGNESSDANTALYDTRYPARPKAWVPGFDSDGNTVSPLLSISESRTALTFKDDVPGDGNPARNFAEMFFPQGIDAGLSTAIVADWAPTAEVLNLEMFARDANGVLKLIDQLQQSAAAAARSPAAFTNNMYGLKLKGRLNAVTGVYETSTAAFLTIQNTAMASSADNGDVAVQFILDQDTLLSGALARLACSGAGTQEIRAQIHRNTQSGGIDIPQEGDAGLVALMGLANVSSTTAAIIKFTTGNLIRLPAGTYWLMLMRSNVAVVTVRWYVSSSGNHGAIARNYRSAVRAAGAWDSSTAATDFKLNTAYDSEATAPIQRELPLTLYSTGARTSLTASIDKPIVTLEPSQTVYVHRMSAFAQALYHYSEDIERTVAAGNKITLDRWGLIPSTVTVDNKLRTATYTENGFDIEFGPTLRDGDYIVLDGGASNTITITNPDISQVDYTSAFRSVKV